MIKFDAMLCNFREWICENTVSKWNQNYGKLKIIPSNTLDVVSMWHVLEHVPDLNERIIIVSNLLKDNGTIIIAVPNLNSPDAKKYKKYWAALDVPRHLYHFTHQSLSNLLAKHNLKIVHAEPMKFDAYYVSMLSEKYLKNSTIFLFRIIIIYNMKYRSKFRMPSFRELVFV
jgi:2-polyprenyl-3-methyl-5-hydroxy-6-metoxy-1,4-benzoquinol methylase